MHETHSVRAANRGLALLFTVLFSLSLCWQSVWAQETPNERILIPLGKAVGIKLFSDGVLVVGTSEVSGATPASDCGLKEGDLILKLNNEKITSTEHIQSLLNENGTQPLTLTYQRGDKKHKATTAAVQCADGSFRLGAWIRDSMAGVGTLTYYDPQTHEYGALGHGITDVDTAMLMPLSTGTIMETSIKAVKIGMRGDPGELKGDFSVQRNVGTLQANTDSGIFGKMSDNDFITEHDAMPIAAAAQVNTGKATILATVSGNQAQEYEVEITRLYAHNQSTRNMLLRVTDQRLLATTGGIVQGMSGSPIIQNGRLVGAVTHVLVNSPDQGYGIFIENMLTSAG